MGTFSRLARMMSPKATYEDRFSFSIERIPSIGYWGRHHRLCVDGNPATIVVFGTLQDLLWHCRKDAPLELKVTIALIRDADKTALSRIAQSGNVPGMLTVSSPHYLLTVCYCIRSFLPECSRDIHLSTLS